LYFTEIQVNTVQRAVLKEQLSAMAAGRNDGIDLDTPERWVVFCDKMVASFRRERNENKRNYDVLQALLRAMENPGKVRILWPWWKRALFFWKK
jgi:hypothetical protein